MGDKISIQNSRKTNGDKVERADKIGVRNLGITIIKGSVGRGHIHVLLSCPTNRAPSKIVQYLKGRSSKLLQDEFPALKKKYWGQHLWEASYLCGAVGSVTEETIKQYIENQETGDVKELFKVED